MKGLYKMQLEMGRSCDLVGLFIAEKTHVDYLVDNNCAVNFGEVAGKHSDISWTFERGDIVFITDEPDKVKFAGENLLIGLNPFSYYVGYGNEDYELFDDKTMLEYITHKTNGTIAELDDNKTPFDVAIENIDYLRSKYPDTKLDIFDRLILDANENEQAKPIHKNPTEFVVAGYDGKHKFYRTQIGRFETEIEAVEFLKQWISKLEDEKAYWKGVSTIIVKVDGDYQKRLWACACKKTSSTIYPKGDYGSFLAY